MEINDRVGKIKNIILKETDDRKTNSTGNKRMKK